MTHGELVKIDYFSPKSEGRVKVKALSFYPT